MTWTDDFTHDYFADGTYTLVEPFGGVEGTDFTVSGGVLSVKSNGVMWEDARAGQGQGNTTDMTLRIVDVAPMFTAHVGLLRPVTGSANRFLGMRFTSLSATEVAISYSYDQPISLYEDPHVTAPVLGQADLRVQVTTTDLIATLSGPGFASYTFTKSLADIVSELTAAGVAPDTALAGLVYSPYTLLSGATDPPPIEASLWMHPSTPPPPPPPPPTAANPLLHVGPHKVGYL